MKSRNTYYPNCNLFSKQLNLSDFGFEKPVLEKIKEINNEIKPNKLLKFIQYAFKYSKIVLKKSIKIYTRSTYRQITDLLELSNNIQEYLHLKKIPHYTTIQKFFKDYQHQYYKN